jgi:hypothetical protein
MRTLHRLAAALALVTVGAVAALLPTGTAHAATLLPGAVSEQVVTIGAASHATLVPLQIDRLAPGSTVTQRFRLHLAGDVTSGRPAVVVSDVRDLERGCNHPEAAAGDVTCSSGADQGELSSQLLAGVQWEPAVAATCAGASDAAPAQSLRSIIDQPLTAPGVTSALDTCVTMTLSLPMSADNLVQSDSVSFDLRVGLVDVMTEGAGELGGRTSGAAGGPLTQDGAGATSLPSTGSARLPFTGLPLLPLGLLALGLIQLGICTLGAARRFRRTAT